MTGPSELTATVNISEPSDLTALVKEESDMEQQHVGKLIRQLITESKRRDACCGARQIGKFIDSGSAGYSGNCQQTLVVRTLDDEWNLSICGLNCAQCDIFKAGQGDNQLRREILDWFKEKRHEEVKPESIRCEGCRGPSENNWSSDCKMMQCARKKGVDYCFQCQSFPCEVLTTFADDGASHHKRTVENLKTIKKMGLEAWIAEQKKKGPPSFCP